MSHGFSGKVKLVAIRVLWGCLGGCVAILLIFGTCFFFTTISFYNEMRNQISTLKTSRVDLIDVVVLLDRTPSLMSGGKKQSALFEEYKYSIINDVLPKLGFGDTLTVYFINHACQFENYLIKAHEIPALRDERQMLEDRNRLLSSTGFRGVKELATTVKDSLPLLNGSKTEMERKIIESRINSSSNVTTDIYCAINLFIKEDSGERNKWIFVFSDFLNDSVATKLEIDGVVNNINRHVRLISGSTQTSSPQNKKLVDQTLGALEVALSPLSDFKLLNINQVSGETKQIGNNPFFDWDRFANFQKPESLAVKWCWEYLVGVGNVGG